MNGRDLALGLVAGLALAGAVRRRGSGNAAHAIFVTTLTGDEVFGHVTTRAGAEAIQRQGFRVGEGKYGTGVYLLSPEEEWGGGLPPAATPAHAFQLRWHEGRTDLRVLRVSLPEGTQLLRVVSSPGDATLQAMKVLHGDAEGTQRYRAAWKRDQEEATLHDDLRSAGLDGIYWVDPVWNADEILVLDPARLSVVREQVQEGSRNERPPEEILEAYSYGKCFWLALALHERHGWPLVAEVETDRADGARWISHAWVEMPDGREFDIYGPQRRVDRFGGVERRVSPEEAFAIIRETSPLSPQKIRAYVKEANEILDRYFPALGGVQEGSAARTVHRTDPALWQAVKAEVTASDKGGRPGQWSARKAQRSVQLYKERGGGYLGPKDPDNALSRWTKQDWRTRSGGESLQTGERYLPAAAFDLLTPAEVGATTRAKRAGLARGQQFTPQPPNIARKTKKAREGAANVIAPSGYDQTAMARTGPSAPVQHLRAYAPELLRGRVLDFGSGRGADAEALRATAYDPHHPKASVRKRPTGTFSTVLATYVLNVLPKDERHAALREAAGYVRPGGHLVLAVRPQAEVAATVSGWARNGDGHQLLGSDGARDRFQRGYTPDQLAREVRAVLGSGFAPVPLLALSGSVVGVWRRA